MLRFSRLLSKTNSSVLASSLLGCAKYYSSTLNQPASAQTQNIPEVIQKRQFISSLYGIEVKKHIFPNFVKTINVSP